MKCKKCEKGKIVLHAFDKTLCQVCNDVIITEHMPGNKVCNNCSAELSICIECGKTAL